MTKYQEEFEQWFSAIEACGDESWLPPRYLSKEWHQYIERRQLALGAFNFALQLEREHD